MVAAELAQEPELLNIPLKVSAADISNSQLITSTAQEPKLIVQEVQEEEKVV